MSIDRKTDTIQELLSVIILSQFPQAICLTARLSNYIAKTGHTLPKQHTMPILEG